MIKSASVLQPIMVEFENESKIFYLDINKQIIYDSNLNVVPESILYAIFSDIEQQNISCTPELPIEEIYEAANVEKQLSQDSFNHVFRRNTNE